MVSEPLSEIAPIRSGQSDSLRLFLKMRRCTAMIRQPNLYGEGKILVATEGAFEDSPRSFEESVGNPDRRK